MSALATAAKPVGFLAKTARRVAVALTLSIGVGLLLMSLWKGPIGRRESARDQPCPAT
jgi:hypothetical protein